MRKLDPLGRGREVSTGREKVTRGAGSCSLWDLGDEIFWVSCRRLRSARKKLCYVVESSAPSEIMG